MRGRAAAGVCALVLAWGGCDRSDPEAVRLVRQAAQAAKQQSVRGRLEVRFRVGETLVVAEYDAAWTVTAAGRRRTLTLRAARVAAGSTPPGLRLERRVRRETAGDLGGVSFPFLVAITDAEVFLAVHRVRFAPASSSTPSLIAGRPTRHIRALPLHPGGFTYDLYVDTRTGYPLALEERNPAGRLCHAYRFLTWNAGSQGARRGGGVPELKPTPLDPEQAARELGLSPEEAFPHRAPPGFPRRELLKAGALHTVHMRFTNGTTTGAVYVYEKRPAYVSVPVAGPLSPQARMRLKQLVARGRAFVAGQYVALTYAVDGFHAVELHTSRRSVLALTHADPGLLRDLIASLPLP